MYACMYVCVHINITYIYYIHYTYTYYINLMPLHYIYILYIIYYILYMYIIYILHMYTYHISYIISTYYIYTQGALIAAYSDFFFLYQLCGTALVFRQPTQIFKQPTHFLAAYSDFFFNVYILYILHYIYILYIYIGRTHSSLLRPFFFFAVCTSCVALHQYSGSSTGKKNRGLVCPCVPLISSSPATVCSLLSIPAAYVYIYIYIYIYIYTNIYIYIGIERRDLC
jgi:hypothetical protein